jgi:subtilase family serine protease
LANPPVNSGLSPAQVSQAYGFDQVSFASGSTTVAGDGQGQTIAIVDAYGDPNIAGDLATFDAHFSLPSANLQIVNQGGGSKLPAQDAEWSSEISLDVEWAHAMAPGANLLLVETNTDRLKDLLAGVNYARSAPGVSVVSLSWGGGEWNGETSYDSYFTTPAGHAGVTFVNASGDDGPGKVEWPASSPNVLSVGGTTLSVTDSAGDNGSETGWKYAAGGTSPFEKMPSYQQGLPSSDTSYASGRHDRWNGQNSSSTTSDRSIPDVAFDADPNTGFAVYDSVPYQGTSGWQVVGGTSAGAPQWAALIAIADQGRALAGNSPLDGATNTLPLLYGIYGNPGTSQYPSYAATMHDVTSGGSSSSPATPGYDQVTGLGTPRAVEVILALGGNPVALAKAVLRYNHNLEHPDPGSGPGSLDVADSFGGPVGTGTTGTYVTISGGLSGLGLQTGAPPTQSSTGTTGTASQGGGTINHSSSPANVTATPTGTQGNTSPTHTSSNQTGGVPAATPVPSVTGGNSRNSGNSLVAASVNAAPPVLVIALAGSGTPAVGRVAATGQLAPAAYLAVAAAESAAPTAVAAARSVSLLSGVSGLSIWSRLSSLLGGAGNIDPMPAAAPLVGSILGLAPSPGTRLQSNGRAWEITAGVCLGVALAGYWYSSATPVEEKTQSLKSTRLRRVREGWELTPIPDR